MKPNNRLPAQLAKLTRAQLDAESDQFDVEFSAIDAARMPTNAERSTHPRKRGRPAKALKQKASRVLVTIEPSLLQRADSYAERNGLTRAGLFQQAVQQFIAR